MGVIRFGVIGCGVIQPTHCDAIRNIEGAELAAVCDVVSERAEKAGKTYDVPHFTNLAPLLERVDAVCVCTPSGLHAKIGVRCAKAGKHVLTEKPLDVTYAAARRLVDACEESGVVLGCVSQHRFAKDMRRLKKAVDGGHFGRIVLADAYVNWYRTQAYYDSGEWRGTRKLDGGGCLMNQGVHYIDMLQWVMGGVKRVRALTRTATHRIEVEDVAATLVEYENGAIGVIQGTTSSYPGVAERIEVHGSHGSAALEGDRTVHWEFDPKGPAGRTARVKTAQPPKEGSAASDPTAIWGEQHRLQIEDFVRAVRRGGEPFVTGEAALAPLRIILAIYKSAARGGARVEV